MSSYIDTQNSSTKPLDNGQSFNGAPSNTNKYQGSLITCVSDQDGFLTVEWSNDNEHWDFSSQHVVVASVPYKCMEQNLGTYIKVSLLNTSGSDQTYLRLTTRFINDVPDAIVDTFKSTLLWDNQLIVNTNYTSSVDLLNTNGKIDIMGNFSDAGTLDIQLSNDDMNWYNAYQLNASSAGNVFCKLETSSRFIKCVYSGVDNTITLILSAK